MNTETQTKHTPGPWTYADGHLQTWAIYACNSGGIASPEPIANIPRPDNDDSGYMAADSNAQLMAAAPELADCCLTALAEFGEKRPADHYPATQALFDKLTTAFAKAGLGGMGK